MSCTIFAQQWETSRKQEFRRRPRSELQAVHASLRSSRCRHPHQHELLDLAGQAGVEKGWSRVSVYARYGACKTVCTRRASLHNCDVLHKFKNKACEELRCIPRRHVALLASLQEPQTRTAAPRAFSRRAKMSLFTGASSGGLCQV